AGASIADDQKSALAEAEIVLKVQRPEAKELALIGKGAVVVSIMDPYRAGGDLAALAGAGVTSFAMDLMPRITRAQTMDVLSSQSNLAGYKAVLDAAAEFGSAFPMMMTAAGTIPPARVLVMGAGVAGLQAIATARRLGAIVSATDVRPAAKEQVESLGASFVAVEDEEFKEAETAGGYAKEMSDAYKEKQAQLIAETIPKQNIVITTALIPGRPAPRLVSAYMVASMKPGSVIVDLAVEAGGNCELSEPGKVVAKHDVKVIGHYNVPSRLAADASRLYARNLFNFLELMIDKDSGALAIDWDDEIIKGTCVTHNGEVVNPDLAKLSAAAPAPAPEAAPESGAEAAPKAKAKPKPKAKAKPKSKTGGKGGEA
ncbi:MAG: Re/Si-specific NAD(P)(+) transhydrogenase subunit alpha, partial [Rhodospirillales bacterium]|nr:Re/Si-specific NAD(P)(+) transhydrogenase subunit alpha [Rhodospirillales bacterium]